MNNGVQKSATKKITISDIAKELDVSPTTISRAISGKGRLSEETRNRVMTYIQENEYRPNVIAKGLAQSKTFNIGVLLPSDANSAETPFFQKALMGVCEVAASHDYDVVVTTMNEQDISLLERIVNNRKVDGVILTRTLVNDLPVEFLKKSDLPFVVIGSTNDSEVVQIDNNHRAGCKELTNYLLMTGVRKIGLLGGNQSYIVNRNRFVGFKEAIEESNLLIHEELVFLNAVSKAFIDRAVESLMKEQVECILCTDDLICSRVLSKLTEDGHEVPEDVKVASFYNSAFLESHNPPITTLDFDVHALGNVAAAKLLDLINNNEVEKRTLLDYRIVLKTSTKS